MSHSRSPPTNNSSDSNSNNRSDGPTPPKNKEKKRVVFTGGRQEDEPPGDLSPASEHEKTGGTTSPGTEDEGLSEAIDHVALSKALSKILEPTTPEPTYYPPTRQQQSEIEAKERADRLAESVYRSDSAASSRAELEAEEHAEEGDVLYATALERTASRAAAERLVRSHTRRLPRAASSNSGRLGSDYFQYDAGLSHLASGTNTPTRDLGDHEHEYVPPPSKYHGGVLSSLLKLYNSSGGAAGGLLSGAGSEQSTPGGTPHTSRPPSPARGGQDTASSSGTATPKRHSGLFPSRRNNGNNHDGGRPPTQSRSSSTLGLANLIESSSVLASTGSADIRQAVSEHLKKERPRIKRSRSSFFSTRSSRPREDDKIRITVHIAHVISRHRFLTKLCRALMMYGAPTHRLEDYLRMSARVLEIEAQFLYMPGCMFISFDDSSTHTAEVKLVRAPQGVDLGKLRDVHGIYKQVVHDVISVDEATVRLDEVMARRVKFGVWLRVFVYGLASVSVAPFAFQGRFIDLPAAFVLGCVVGALALVAAPSSELYANVFEISAAVITSFLARALGSVRGGTLFCFSSLAQSSIALILPGYLVLCGSLELQSHNIVAGSVRLVYAMIYTLFLGYGITIGASLYGVLDHNATSQTSCHDPLSRPWYLLFVPLFTICLCIINQAKWKQVPIMVLISFASFCVNTYASSYFTGNAQIPSTLGALCVGVLANLYSRTSPHLERLSHRIWNGHVLPRLSRWCSRGSRRRQREFYDLHALNSTVGGVDNNGSSNNDTRNRDRGAPESTCDLESGVGTGAASPTATFNNSPSDVNGSSTAVSEAGDPTHHTVSSASTSTSTSTGGPTTGQKAKANCEVVVGYGLAAAAMLPAIFVQVPSGLAANGSLLSSINAADQLRRNGTASASNGLDPSGVNSVAFTVLFSVIQVAIGISVGLFLSALLVYPYGKRRSGLFSF